jgi:NADH:ubiquinone oxidoreductase subunit D
MHGTVRRVPELSGETVVHADLQIEYLHRAFEKRCGTDGLWCFSDA